jgi:hypothetical protein
MSPSAWGDKSQGAGRRQNRTGNFVRDVVAKDEASRTSLYRDIQRVQRLTPEAREFAVDINNTRLITGKALDVAGEFEAAEEQLAVLRLAVEQRKARRRLTLITALQHLERVFSNARENA